MAVKAPSRLVTTRPQIGAPEPRRTSRVDIDVSKSDTRGGAVHFRSLYGPRIEAEENGSLRFSCTAGTNLIQLVAEDATGKRSFPRTVAVTVTNAAVRGVPILKLYGEHTVIPPGTTGNIPLGANVGDFAVNRIVVDFSVRDRLSGIGKSLPTIANGFALSPALLNVGATVSASLLLGGMGMHLEITWDPSKKLAGRFDLGTLTVSTPADAPPGSTHLLTGKAWAIATGAEEVKKAMQTLSPLIRIWGGPEPHSVRISGPTEVSEESTIELEAIADGLPVETTNAGWWTNSITGKVRLLQTSPGSLKAQVTGLRAGRLKVSVVVGTTVAETVIRVKAKVKPALERYRRPPLLLPVKRV